MSDLGEKMKGDLNKKGRAWAKSARACWAPTTTSAWIGNSNSHLQLPSSDDGEIAAGWGIESKVKDLRMLSQG